MSEPWAAPDATPAQPAPAGVEPTAPVDETPDARSESPLPPPPLALRPMTIPDLFDGAFEILKRRPRDVFLLAAAFIIPVQLVSSILLRDSLGAAGFFGTGLGDPTSTVGFDESGELTGAGSLLVSVAVEFVALAMLAGALGLLVQDWYAGERRTPGRIVVATLRRGPALVVGVVVVHVFEAVGLLGLGVGAYIVMGLMHVVAPATTVEGLGPFAAVGRSLRLTGSRFWRSMGVPALVALIGMLVGFGFQLIPEVAVALTPESWNWLMRSAGAALAQLVIAPFTAGVAVLYHLDLRIRTEGFDLQRRVQAFEART